MSNFIGMVFATLKNEGIDTSGMSTDEAVKKYNELQKKTGGKAGADQPTPAENKKINQNQIKEMKAKQLEIISKFNPMKDDYHTGIRKVEDIKTFDEVIDDEESFVWGDFEKEDAEEALKKGYITVYSSYPIKQGTFVSTSKNQAEEYAGGRGKQIYSKTLPLTKVAWINGDEGQFADIEEL